MNLISKLGRERTWAAVGTLVTVFFSLISFYLLLRFFFYPFGGWFFSSNASSLPADSYLLDHTKKSSPGCPQEFGLSAKFEARYDFQPGEVNQGWIREQGEFGGNGGRKRIRYNGEHFELIHRASPLGLFGNLDPFTGGLLYYTDRKMDVRFVKSSSGDVEVSLVESQGMFGSIECHYTNAVTAEQQAELATGHFYATIEEATKGASFSFQSAEGPDGSLNLIISKNGKVTYSWLNAGRGTILFEGALGSKRFDIVRELYTNFQNQAMESASADKCTQTKNESHLQVHIENVLHCWSWNKGSDISFVKNARHLLLTFFFQIDMANDSQPMPVRPDLDGLPILRK